MKIQREIIWTPEDCKRAEKFLLGCILIANDIETIPFKKSNKHDLFVMTINCYTGIDSKNRVKSFCFPLQVSKSPASGAPTHIEDIFVTMKKVNESGIKFTGHNFTYDLAWLIRYGLPVANYAYDSMTMWWSRYPDLPKTLDFVSSILLDHYQYWKAGRKDDNFIAFCNYGMDDTESTLLNTITMLGWLEKDERVRRNFFRAHSRCIAGLSMSMRGIAVNTETMEKFRVELQEKANEALERIQYLVADPGFNPNSPAQKSDLLYNLLGIRLRNAKGRFVKKQSEASTGAVVLRACRSDHPIFKRVANGIIEALEPAKQLSNVVGLKMLDKPNRRPRFLTSYDGVGTTTSRFSSRGSAFGHGGNAQNVRKKYRAFGESDANSLLMEVDFSAADDVFVAFESQEQKKIDLARSGRDIHATNALIFFENWTYDGIVSGKKADDPRVVHPITGVRQITKKLVHGNHYLMAGLTLLMSAGREAIVAAAKELGHEDAGLWTQDRLVKFCGTLEDKFRTHYPRFARVGPHSWYNDLRNEVASAGGFTTIFSYFQRFLSDPREDSTLRAIAATAGQANTAGRVNMAMDELELGIRTLAFRDGPAPDKSDRTRQVSHASHGVSIRLQTHDSITFNINFRHPRWAEGVDDILHVMSRPVVCKGEVFQVGIEAEASVQWAGKPKVDVTSSQDIAKFLTDQKFL